MNRPQKIGLHQLALFAQLQEELWSVTPEQIAALLPQASAVPKQATVVGFVPEPLKALLVLNDRHCEDVYYPLFELALVAEFPELAGKGGISTGPNFEVFYTRTTQFFGHGELTYLPPFGTVGQQDSPMVFPE